jgi:hypothetical protein
MTVGHTGDDVFILIAFCTSLCIFGLVLKGVEACIVRYASKRKTMR